MRGAGLKFKIPCECDVFLCRLGGGVGLCMLWFCFEACQAMHHGNMPLEFGFSTIGVPIGVSGDFFGDVLIS